MQPLRQTSSEDSGIVDIHPMSLVLGRLVDPTAISFASVRPSPPTPGDQTRLVTIRAPDGPARCLHRRGVLGARPPPGGLTTKGGQYGAGPTARSKFHGLGGETALEVIAPMASFEFYETGEPLRRGI